MQYNFLNIFFDKKEMLNQSKGSINPFLLENNHEQIEKLYNFYGSKTNLLYINGFLGTGKSEIADYSLAFLSSETLVLKYTCFNSTILDDILLSFFNDFRNLASQKIISEPKAKSENFTQKINSYFSQIEKPFVIIINSFEAVLDENRQEILDFLIHLNSIPKLKIIVIAKTFESQYFKEQQLERITTFALEKNIFEKYLRTEKIKFSHSQLDEFYKHTRGYYFFTAFSVKLMNHKKISLADFLTNFKNSFLTFFEFVEKESRELVPAKMRNLFWFLTMTRHPISINLLKTLNLYDEEKIEFLREHLVISQNNQLIYVEDYFREQADYDSAVQIAQKIRQYIIDLYETQLPLKPLERNILISRQTMRKEIEYHQFFLPKKPKTVDHSKIGVSYLAYSKGLEFGEKVRTEDEKESESKKQPLDYIERKNININIENLPYQEKNIMGIKKYNPPASSDISDAEYSNLSLMALINMAKDAEADYEYLKVLEIFEKALELKDDANYKAYLPSIYKRIANAYNKIGKYENAIKYYKLAEDIYTKAGNTLKANYTKLRLARIYYETYKMDLAKETSLQILSYEQNTAILTTRTYILLANIEESLSNTNEAFEYYKKALNESSEEMDTKVLSELYFKIALILDESDSPTKAIEFYNKCMNLDGNSDTSKFLSPTYSNIAALYLEKNDTENALINYQKAYELDYKSDNIEGTYYSASKIAAILQRKEPKKALEYFEKALEAAEKTKDIFYIASASLAIGDFHYESKQNEIALKHYIKTLKSVENKFSKDNIDKIKLRINDIKFRLGEENFEKTLQIIENEIEESKQD